MIGEIATLVDLEENRLNEARLKLAVVQLLIQISIFTDYIIRKDEGFRDEKRKSPKKYLISCLRIIIVLFQSTTYLKRSI